MELFRKRSLKKVLSFVMMMVLALSGLCTSQFTTEVKASGYVTIKFIDNTPEKWVGNNSAVMELVDNTHGHVAYSMVKTGAYTWSATVPESAYNITFNRYDPSKTIKWNSFSAGGRDGYCCYSALAHDYGKWIPCEGEGFKAGDVVYLDTSSFTSWEDYSAIMYVNFSSVSKRDNNGNDIPISYSIVNPKRTTYWGNHLYRYVVTSADEGSSVLRFWRGNGSTLWNCSVTLTYGQYKSGYNCVKVTGWNESGYCYRR